MVLIRVALLLLLLASPAQAAITEVASQRATLQATTFATTTIAFPGNVTANNLVTFLGGFWSATLDGPITSVTCSKSAGTATVGAFTTLLTSTGAAWSGGTAQIAICYALVTGTGSLTLGIATNVGTATNYVSGTTDEFTGQSTTAPLDANGTETAGTGTTQSCSVTTGSANSLVLAGMVTGGTNTITTTTAGATEIYNDGASTWQPNASQFKVVGAAGAQTMTWSTTNNLTYACIALGIKEPGAANKAGPLTGQNILNKSLMGGGLAQ